MDGRTVLLVGARCGVLLVDRCSGRATRFDAVPDQTWTTGINRAVVWNECVYASHSQAGILSWTLRDAVWAGRHDLRGAGHLCVLDDNRLLFGIGPDLFTLDRENAIHPLPGAGRAADVIAIFPSPSIVIVARANGTVSQLDRATLKTIKDDARCGPASAAAILPWLDALRICLATASGICCIGLDDAIVSHYRAPRNLAALAASRQFIAGVTADRQRLLIWNLAAADQTPIDMPLNTVTPHRLADIHFTDAAVRGLS